MLGLAGSSATASTPHDGRTVGLFGKVRQISIQNFNAKRVGNRIVKGEKTNVYGEEGYFPNAETQIYSSTGQIQSVSYAYYEIQYNVEYSYQNGLVSEEKTYQNRKLYTDRKFTYQNNELVQTVEDLYGMDESDHTTNVYKADPQKVKIVNGNRIEFQDDVKNYTITAPNGQVLKTSLYNDMEEAQEIKTYEYNDKGWLIKSTMQYSADEIDTITYEYSQIDEQGNWRTMLIKQNGKPYGITERQISYYN